MESRLCAVCHKEFMPANGMAKYCGKECRKSGVKKIKESKKSKKPNKSLREMQREAREHGMTYGKYVAWLEGGIHEQ